MEEDAGRGGRERPDGVNKKRIPELNLDAKVSIYHKPTSKSPNVQLVAAFPKEALTLFSRAALDTSRKVQDNEQKFDLYQVRGGDVASLKMIFEWIQDCLDQQSITKFPDLPEPDDDPYEPTLKVILAANVLDVPAGSLQFFLEKRLRFIARKNLMPFSQVRVFYTGDSELYQAGLRYIACNSIFNAWWDYRLDATINPSLMEALTDLRKEFSELDADLHEACKKNEEEVNHRRQEKKLKREAGTQAVNDEGAQAWEVNGTTTIEGDWNTPADGDTSTWSAGDDWNKENEPATIADVAEDNSAPRPQGDSSVVDGGAKAVLDWADESAAEYQLKSQKTLASVPTSW